MGRKDGNTLIIDGISNNELGITFNGIHSRDFGLRVSSISDPMPTLNDANTDIQPMIGDLYQGTDIQSKTINVTFRLVGARSYQEKYKRLHDIWSWLMPENGEEVAFTIDFLPNWTWYAHVSASFDVTDSLYQGTFTVPFTCSDPRAYGPMRQYQIGPRNLAIGAGETFTSSGTAGQIAKLYELDVDADIWNGTMSLRYSWSASDITGMFKIRRGIVDDDGIITYTDLSTVTVTTASGKQTTTIKWAAVTAGQSSFLSFDQVSGGAKIQIYDLQIAKIEASGFDQVINEITNLPDGTLVTINSDNTVTLHDADSTAESFPTFILHPQTDITKIGIADLGSEDYLYLGSEVDPDSTDQVVNNEPLVVHDYCQTMNTWHDFSNPSSTDSDATEYLPPFALENGVIGVDSKMKGHTESIGVGTNSDGSYRFGKPLQAGKWNGAGAMHNTFPGAYTDWQISLRLQMNVGSPRAQGKLEIYLLDENNLRMGKIMLKDNLNNGEAIAMGIEIGTHDQRKGIYNGTGKITKGKTTKVALKTYKNGTLSKSTVKIKKKSVVQYSTKYLPQSTDKSIFTNFFGTITFRKVGHLYSVSIMKMDVNSGKNAWSTPVKGSWNDTEGTYDGHKLANCAVYMAKFPIAEDLASPAKGYSNDHMYLTDLKVYNIIDGGNDALQTPVPIAKAGDEIHINTSDGTITKNGNLFNSSNNHLIKAPGSNVLGLSLRGAADKTLSFYPTEGWSIAHQSVFY